MAVFSNGNAPFQDALMRCRASRGNDLRSDRRSSPVPFGGRGPYRAVCMRPKSNGDYAEVPSSLQRLHKDNQGQGGGNVAVGSTPNRTDQSSVIWRILCPCGFRGGLHHRSPIPETISGFSPTKSGHASAPGALTDPIRRSHLLARIAESSANPKITYRSLSTLSPRTPWSWFSTTELRSLCFLRFFLFQVC